MPRLRFLMLAGLFVCGVTAAPAVGQTDLADPSQPPSVGVPPADAHAPPGYVQPPLGTIAPAPPASPDSAPQRGARIVERFRAANTTNDGRLTLQQAEAAGLIPVVRHFGELDSSNKGYITLQDIRSYIQRMRAMRAQAPSVTQ